MGQPYRVGACFEALNKGIVVQQISFALFSHPYLTVRTMCYSLNQIMHCCEKSIRPKDRIKRLVDFTRCSFEIFHSYIQRLKASGSI